ncbi:MAG: DUF1501 domain-containing protein [Candidatus Omnitrophica bacterium]|nr:DUF1501 domain-containing protein [Candidatus Omnitrophota bacterium]MCM8825463.1 DUF1501 domain-containing protein [Candidatus Omnitrophota bacterium]
MKSRIVLVSIFCAAAMTLAAGDSLQKTKAKSVIQIWMWGGPSQNDTFDPKPAAGYDYCGQLDKAIPTNVPGIEINASLPMLAKIADKYSIIRSMTHGINGHESAAYYMQTGHKPGTGLVYPSLGAIVCAFKGKTYAGKIPPYIVLTQSQGRFSEEGFLGPLYKPFVTGGDPGRPVFAVEGIVAEGITQQQQQRRRELLGNLDNLGRLMPDYPDFVLFDQAQNEAYEMILGETRKVFDLSEEPDEVRNRYGRNWFGQTCLVARRLVEKGVPYITINYPGWDTHKQHFQTMQRKLSEFDQGLSALIEDLEKRNLLETTIIWCSGEFGRTPKIQWEPPWNGGRNHWGHCFSVLVAGGGFKGGFVVGASDDKGEYVAQRPVYPEDLLRSILKLIGIDPDENLPNDRGIDVKVLPYPEGYSGQGELIEIMGLK